MVCGLVWEMDRIKAVEDLCEYTATLVSAAYGMTIGFRLATGNWGDPGTPLSYPMYTIVALFTVLMTLWCWED